MLIEYNGIKPRVHKTAFVEDSARVIGNVELGENVSVWFNAVMRGDVNKIKIGKNTNIQDFCILHVADDSPASIGENVTLGHGAVVHGCTVASNCLIGIRSTLLDYSSVGEWSIIGASALVTERTVIPPRSIALGVPARVTKQIDDKGIELIKTRCEDYLRLKESYKKRTEQ